MHFLALALALTSLLALGTPVDAREKRDRHLAGQVEAVDRKSRTLVIQGVRVEVPRKVRGLRRIRVGEPVLVELEPGTGPARATRIEAVPD